MDWSDRVRCRNCRAVNDAQRRFCVQCGAPLPPRDSAGGKRSIVGRVARGFGVLVLLVVLLGVAYGIYYVADRYFLNRIGTEAVEVQTAGGTETTQLSSTTTTIPRADRNIAGAADRYGTAVAITKLAFPDGVPALVLVSGEDASQAILAAPLAGAYQGAVLLVPSDGLTDELRAEITRLAPTQVFLVGVARPKRVTSQLQDILKEPEVKSLAGDNAPETAALVAAEIKAKKGSVAKVVVVPDGSISDALAVSPVAAANGWPILLADQNGDVPDATNGAIKDLGATSALIVGSTAQVEVSDIDRQVGKDADETDNLVYALAAGQGMSYEHTVIVAGDVFTEGIVCSPYIARDKGMLLLAMNGQLPAATQSLLDQNLKDIRTLDIVGLPQVAKSLTTTTTTTTTEQQPESTTTLTSTVTTKL